MLLLLIVSDLYLLVRMGKTMHKHQIETWKETNWPLILQPSEIVPKTKKRKAENVFVQAQVKKIARLQSLKAANTKLEKIEKEHKQLATSLGLKVTVQEPTEKTDSK